MACRTFWQACWNCKAISEKCILFIDGVKMSTNICRESEIRNYLCCVLSALGYAYNISQRVSLCNVSRLSCFLLCPKIYPPFPPWRLPWPPSPWAGLVVALTCAAACVATWPTSTTCKPTAFTPLPTGSTSNSTNLPPRSPLLYYPLMQNGSASGFAAGGVSVLTPCSPLVYPRPCPRPRGISCCAVFVVVLIWMASNLPTLPALFAGATATVKNLPKLPHARYYRPALSRNRPDWRSFAPGRVAQP